MGVPSWLKSLVPINFRIGIGKNTDTTNIHVGTSNETTAEQVRTVQTSTTEIDGMVIVATGFAVISALALFLWIYRARKSGKHIKQLIVGTQAAKEYVPTERRKDFSRELERMQDEDTKCIVKKVKRKIK